MIDDPLSQAVDTEAEHQAPPAETDPGVDLGGELAPAPGALPAGMSTAGLLTRIFRIIARNMAPNWDMPDQDFIDLGEGWAPAADRYLSVLTEKYPELVAGLLVTAIVIEPHLDTPRFPPKPAADEAEAD